jgi:hypothetical protein
MVAVAQYIPTDPEEKATVLAVLREHPELREFLQRAIQKASEIFPEPHVTFDTERYDKDDPLVWLQIYVKEPLLAFNEHYHQYAYWLANEANYPVDLIGVLPLWTRPDYEVTR